MVEHAVRTAVAVALLAFAATACDGGPGSPGPYVASASGLCEVSTMIERGEVDLAREEFHDTVHQPLHDLAAETSDVDRTVAAALLEAKESIESGFASDDGPMLKATIDELVVAVDEALRATGHRSLPCAPGDTS